MSVLITLRLAGDPSRLEQFASEHAETLEGIADRARASGCLSHRFYGSDDGQVLVVDEWESAEAFQKFFESTTEIPAMMADVGVTSEPDVTFWRKLDTNDEI
jgi:heme-degrading monooxygenase HmoA